MSNLDQLILKLETLLSKDPSRLGADDLPTNIIVKKIQEFPWVNYKYELQEICQKDYAYYSVSHENSPSNSIKEVLVESFEFCADLSNSFCYTENTIKSKPSKGYENGLILYELAVTVKNIFNNEPGFEGALQEDQRVYNKEFFIDELCLNYLGKLLKINFKDENIKMVFRNINYAIARLKKINLTNRYHHNKILNKTRSTWIDGLMILKEEIEGILLIESSNNLNKISWEGAELFSIKNNYRLLPEILMPHPKTGSYKETIRFIDYYLKLKAKETGVFWIAELLKNMPKTKRANDTIAITGYYKYLAQFYYNAIKSGVFKNSITLNDFRAFLIEEYNNTLPFNISDFSPLEIKVKTMKPTYKIFNDMNRQFQSFI